ncbi:glutamyl-tRNA reductase [Effusibacillus lacus]|uniref:Glutamyl-tRNA reductase n=1 Tax=Effusibacillus lacus TaxID=1348429 RepID=A0A292YMU5_9BACL|nr:glutamyl-tRNA reductase [Effusibacillus lacus]TCS76471.1 glutamyl-tRNA reductase [Effusibacillus lacus]GAX90506.1 glutamyl-tRNA reductase [Effusibacillus lacus]
MNILAIGLNYRTAPVEIREKFAILEHDLEDALRRLVQAGCLAEAVVVSTCNRTEVYAVAYSANAGREEIIKFLADASGISREVFLPYLYIHADDLAVRHLFRVTCGLDSMVLGETQILGQVKDAFLFAQGLGTTGATFNNLFKRAVTLAKQAHSETEIGRYAVSVSYAAVELAKKIFEELTNKTVLIIGAGKMSELTAKHLYSSGARRVLVVNRTFERAKELADKFEGHALELKSIDLALKEADIVISSTGAEGYVVTKNQVGSAMKQRRFRPLFMIDIAVPRDLDPKINDLDNVFLYDIDDLEGVIAANLEERRKEARKIEQFLEQELVAFKQWQTERAAIPLIQALQKKAGGIQKSVMESLRNKLPNLTDREMKHLEKHTMSIVNQLLRDPIQQLKEMATEQQADLYLEVFSRIFALEETAESASKHSSPEPESPEPEGREKRQPQAAVTVAKSETYQNTKATVETQWFGGLSR